MTREQRREQIAIEETEESGAMLSELQETVESIHYDPEGLTDGEFGLLIQIGNDIRKLHEVASHIER